MARAFVFSWLEEPPPNQMTPSLEVRLCSRPDMPGETAEAIAWACIARVAFDRAITIDALLQRLRECGDVRTTADDPWEPGQPHLDIGGAAIKQAGKQPYRVQLEPWW